jgi:hypothetical protein
MQKKILWIGLVLVLTNSLQVNAQYDNQDSTYRKWFIGSTLYLLGNLDKTNNPEYVQLNVGYRITPKDVVSFEFKRSIYSWPIGIPFGPSFDAPGLNYPGHARILAPTLAYQRFWWKGVYTSVHALNAFEKYINKDNKKIGNGFTLYLDSYLVISFNFLKNASSFNQLLDVVIGL